MMAYRSLVEQGNMESVPPNALVDLQAFVDTGLLQEIRQHLLSRLSNLDQVLVNETGVPKIRVFGYTADRPLSGSNGLQLDIYFEALESLDLDWYIFLRGYPYDATILPADRRQMGFVSLDHAPIIPTSDWAPGKIYRDSYTIRVHPGDYHWYFGFFSGDRRLTLQQTRRDTIDLGLHPVGCPAMRLFVDQTEYGPHVGEIVGKEGGTRQVGQNFVMPEDGTITAIELVFMANFGRTNDRDVALHLLVKETGLLTEVRTSVVNARNIGNGKPILFRFEPVNVQAGQELHFFVGSPTSIPGNAVTLFYSLEDVYAGGNMVLNGSPQEGDLAFRVIGLSEQGCSDACRGDEVSFIGFRSLLRLQTRGGRQVMARVGRRMV